MDPHLAARQYLNTLKSMMKNQEQVDSPMVQITKEDCHKS